MERREREDDGVETRANKARRSEVELVSASWSMIIEDCQEHIRNNLSYSARTYLGATCKSERSYWAYALFDFREKKMGIKIPRTIIEAWTIDKSIFFDAEIGRCAVYTVIKYFHIRCLHQSLARDSSHKQIEQILQQFDPTTSPEPRVWEAKPPPLDSDTHFRVKKCGILYAPTLRQPYDITLRQPYDMENFLIGAVGADDPSLLDMLFKYCERALNLTLDADKFCNHIRTWIAASKMMNMKHDRSNNRLLLNPPSLDYLNKRISLDSTSINHFLADSFDINNKEEMSKLTFHFPVIPESLYHYVAGDYDRPIAPLAAGNPIALQTEPYSSLFCHSSTNRNDAAPLVLSFDKTSNTFRFALNRSEFFLYLIFSNTDDERGFSYNFFKQLYFGNKRLLEWFINGSFSPIIKQCHPIFRNIIRSANIEMIKMWMDSAHWKADFNLHSVEQDMFFYTQTALFTNNMAIIDLLWFDHPECFYEWLLRHHYITEKKPASTRRIWKSAIYGGIQWKQMFYVILERGYTESLRWLLTRFCGFSAEFILPWDYVHVIVHNYPAFKPIWATYIDPTVTCENTLGICRSKLLKYFIDEYNKQIIYTYHDEHEAFIQRWIDERSVFFTPQEKMDLFEAICTHVLRPQNFPRRGDI